MPSGGERNLRVFCINHCIQFASPIGTHFSRTERRLQPYSRMYSASELKSVLHNNWPGGEAQTQVDVLDMEYQVDNERHSLKWEQRLGDTALLSCLSDVRVDA